jgi:transcription termination factor NusB
MRYFIFLFTLFLVACSEYPEMEMDILAQHIYSQNPIDLDSQNKEYVAMLAKSFGMKEDEIVDIQKHILSKKTTSRMKQDYEAALQKKIFELKQRNRKSAQKDFIVNVLAPYLDDLSRGHIYKSGLENEVFEREICELYEKFFSEANV